jgi:hypothetical protein
MNKKADIRGEVPRTRGSKNQRFQEPQVPRTTGSKNHRFQEPQVPRTTGSKNHRFQEPQVPRTTGSKNHRFQEPQVPRTTGSKNHRFQEPQVPRTTGSKNHRFQEPQVPRTTGSKNHRFQEPQVPRTRLLTKRPALTGNRTSHQLEAQISIPIYDSYSSFSAANIINFTLLSSRDIADNLLNKEINASPRNIYMYTLIFLQFLRPK